MTSKIDDLIARSSIGAALADIKARGIDAHLVDLERQRRTKKAATSATPPTTGAHSMITFRECAACADKAGSPTLCAACLHNRTTIDRLLAALRLALDGWEISSTSEAHRRKIDVLRAEFDA